MLVETHDLTKRYGRITAPDRCTLSVTRGEVFGLLGPNGSGKTTLLRLLMGYLRPTTGLAGQSTVWIVTVKALRFTSALPIYPAKRGCFAGCAGQTFWNSLCAAARWRSAGAVAIAERLDLDLSRKSP